jgi:transcriptional regulator with XRE-family HTH domain
MLIQTIKKLNKEKGISYRDLAIEFKCSFAWLNEVVNGKKDPNLHLLREVARYTGKSYDALMEVYIPINQEKAIDLDIIRELFARRKTQTPQRHIRPLVKRPSFIEKKLIENIKEVTDFEFNQVTLNYNHLMKAHRHKNEGISHAILLGDFEGGALCVEDGNRFEEKNVWFTFNGTKNHWVEPFSGERFSLILYKR